MSRKYTKEILQDAVSRSYSWAATLRYLKLQDTGGNRNNLQKNVRDLGIDTTHFTGQGHYKGTKSPRKKHHSEYLVLRPEGSRRLTTSVLRRAMVEYGFIYECCFSDCPTHQGWINGPIEFEIDHIDGNNLDNRPFNLRFMCAICHTQQPTSSHSWKNSSRYGKSRMCECGEPKRYSSKQCVVCFRKSRRKSSASSKKPIPRKCKIDWPDVDKLSQMVVESNYSAVARTLGVSDNAVRKRLRTRST